MSERSARSRRGRRLAVLMLVSIIVACGVPALMYFAVFLPVETGYNDLFTSHYTMATHGATFEGIDQQVLIFWAQMNATFGTRNHDKIYNSPFYWNHVDVNSLASVDSFLGQLHTRALNYEAQYASMKKTAGAAQGINDWYTTAVENMKNEVTRGPWSSSWGGSFSDVVHDAYMLNIRPTIYWLGWVAWAVFLAWAVLAIAAGLIILKIYW